MKGLIVLNEREIHRGTVLEQVALHALSLKEASEIMSVGYRQAKRLYRQWCSKGLEGLCHGNRGQSVEHAISDDLVTRILDLHDKEYSNFNDSHFTEMLDEREDIHVSREKIRQILRSAGRRPKRKRRVNKHRSRRPRKNKAGIMMQWDGSPHRWFGPDRPACCLMAAIDDANSKLLGALFVPVESSAEYLRLLDMVLCRHGAPLSVYQDRHSALMRTDDHWSVEEQLRGEQFPTHVGRVLGDLDIKAIPAYSPQAKGRVERNFGVQQDRLIAELEFFGITEMVEANQWLDDHYISRHNQRFAKPAAESGHVFRKVSKRERYEKVAFAYEAVVGNDNCIRLGGLMIDVPPGRRRRSFAKAKVLVKQHLDGKWSIWLEEERIATHPATPFKEPVRTWKHRQKGDPKLGRSMTQVYISSKPAPLP